METPEIIKLKRRLDGLQDRLSDMMDDVHELQQDIQFLYRSVEKIYEIIEEEEDRTKMNIETITRRTPSGQRYCYLRIVDRR